MAEIKSFLKVSNFELLMKMLKSQVEFQSIFESAVGYIVTFKKLTFEEDRFHFVDKKKEITLNL